MVKIMNNLLIVLSFVSMFVFALMGTPILTLAAFVVLSAAVLVSFKGEDQETKVFFNQSERSESHVS